MPTLALWPCTVPLREEDLVGDQESLVMEDPVFAGSLAFFPFSICQWPNILITRCAQETQRGVGEMGDLSVLEYNNATSWF